MIQSAVFDSVLDAGWVPSSVVSPDHTGILAGAQTLSVGADFQAILPTEYHEIQGAAFEGILDVAPSPVSSAHLFAPLWRLSGASFSADFDNGEGLSGSPTTSTSADFESQLFDVAVPIPGAEVVVTEEITPHEDGWIDDTFGGRDRTFQFGEPFGSIQHLLAGFNGDGLVQEVAGEGIIVKSPLSAPTTPTGAGIFSSDLWLHDELLRWEVFFELRSFLGMETTIPMFFFPDTVPRQTFTRANLNATALHGIEVASLDGGTVLNLRAFYTDADGVKHWWDGDEWKNSSCLFGRVYLGRTYLFHLEKDETHWRLEVHDLTTDYPEEVKILAVEIPVEGVLPSAGWIGFGDLVCGDPPHLNTVEVLVKALHRGRGTRESDTSAQHLPDFVTYAKVGRPARSTFSRYGFAYRLRDGSNTFLPQFRKIAIPETPQDRYVTLGAGSWGRLDRISFQEYGTTRLWWVLALANGIKNPHRVEPGTVLRVPPMSVVSSKVLPEVPRG